MASVVPALLLKALVVASCVALATCKNIQPQPCEVRMIAYYTERTGTKKTAQMYGSMMSSGMECQPKETCVVNEILMDSGPVGSVDEGVGTCEAFKTEDAEEVAKHCNSAGVMSVGWNRPETWCMAAKKVNFVVRRDSVTTVRYEDDLMSMFGLMSIETWGDTEIIKFFGGHPKWDPDREAAKEAHKRLQKEEDMRLRAEKEHMSLMYGAH